MVLTPGDETVLISVQKSSELNDILCTDVLDLHSFERRVQIFSRDLAVAIIIKRLEPLMLRWD